MTQREIANELELSQTTVRYYLKKFGLRTANSRGPRNTVILDGVCVKHGVTASVSGKNTYCMKCNSEGVSERRRRLKQILVEEHGGSCKICGYAAYVGGLTFHHRNPEEKEFNLSNMRKSLSKCREEAAKCILLCHNCHSEVHAGITDIPLVA